MACIAGVVARCSIAWRLLLPLAACLVHPAAAADPPDPPGLAATPPEVVENTRTGYRSLLAVGTLNDGGHAVAWLAREAKDLQGPWQPWVQRYDRNGRKSGPARAIVIDEGAAGSPPDAPADPRQVAALVRRDATLALAWATLRPYQSNLPGLLVSSVRARHFGLDGKPRGLERRLDQALWQRGQPDAATHEDVVMAQWSDGRYLVGWTTLDAWNRPSCTVQRLAADGRLLAPLDRLGPVAGRGMKLSTLEAGGWLATTIAQAADGQLHADITQVDVHPPIGLPLLPTLPLRSFVVDLGSKGRLLLAGELPHDARPPQAQNTPWSLWFTPGGREADRTGTLPAQPTMGVPLDDGTWVGLWPHAPSGRMWAQRFDAQGAPLGGPLLTNAGRAVQAQALARGALLLAWVGLGADSSGGTNVFMQRLAPVP